MKKELPKEKYKKEYYIILTVLGLLLAGLIAGIAIQQSRPYTLGKLISEFNKLDKRYDTFWRKEKLNGMMVSNNLIDDYLKDLENIEQKIKKQEHTEPSLLSDTKTLMLKLIDARKEMLEAERSYQEFLSLGDGGRINHYINGMQVVINETIDCTDKPQLIKGAEILNETLKKSHNIINMLDFILQNSEEARSPDFIGIKKQDDDTRLEFYKQKLGELLKFQMDVNLAVANGRCKNY